MAKKSFKSVQKAVQGFSELGVHDLENNLTDIIFPKCHVKIRETYSMGNGKIVDNPNEAAELYLQREFIEISNCQSVLHSPIFVPDIFIFNSVKEEVKLVKFNSIQFI